MQDADDDFQEEMDEESDEDEAFGDEIDDINLEGVDWSDASDDGDGGHFKLQDGSEFASILGMGASKPSAGGFGTSSKATGVGGGGGGGGGCGGARSKAKFVMEGPDMDEIWKELKPRKKQKKRKGKDGNLRKRRGAQVGPEVEALLGDANTKFAFGELEEARVSLLEAIRISPGYPDSYHTMGLIYQEQGEVGKQLECFIIAAHLTGKDHDLWKQLTTMSREQGNIPQALYCINRALRLKTTADCLFLKSQLLEEQGLLKKAADTLSSLLPKLGAADHGRRTEACSCLARIHFQLSEPEAAVGVLESWIAKREGGLGGIQEEELHTVNMLLECLIMIKRHTRGLEHVEALEKSNIGLDLPVDIAVKKGIFLIGCGRHEEAQSVLQPLWSLTYVEYGDLYFDLAEAWREVGARDGCEAGAELLNRALGTYSSLEAIDRFNQPGLWLSQAKCYHALSRLETGDERKRLVESAVEVYDKVRSHVPGNSEALSALGELYEEQGKTGLQIQELALFAAGAKKKRGGRAGSLREPKPAKVPKKKKEKEAKESKEERAARLKEAREEKAARAKALKETREKKRYSVAENNARTRAQVLEAYGILYQRARLKFEMGEWQDVVNLIRPILPVRETLPRRRGAKSVAADATRRVGAGEELHDKAVAAALGAERPGIPRIDGEEEREENEELDREGEANMVSLLKRGGVPSSAFMKQALGEEAYFDACVCALKALTTLGRLEEAASLSSECLVSGRFPDTQHTHVLRLWSVVISLQSGAFLTAYDNVKYVCLMFPDSVAIWNLYSNVVNKAGNIRNQHKFVLRCLLKNPESVPCMILTGHHCLVNGTVKLALGEYLRAAREIPSDPLIHLLIANAYLSHIMSRRCHDRHTTCIRAFTYLLCYAKYRNWTQEVYYNLGRALQQLSLYSMAIPCYEHVLQMGPPVCATVNLAESDLKREAAYNLAMIYRDSGSNDLARSLLVTYCTF